MFMRSIAATLVTIPLCASAMAGELQDMTIKAETQAKAGQHVQAIETMREALVALWGQSPLQFRRALFVSQKAAGFGIFKKRASSEFQKGEPLLIYVEPIGYGWKQEGSVYKSNIAADFELRDTKGKILAGQKDFASFKLASYDRNTEYFMNVTYTLTGLPAGAYVIGTQLRDTVTGKSASFDLPFSVK